MNPSQDSQLPQPHDNSTSPIGEVSSSPIPQVIFPNTTVSPQPYAATNNPLPATTPITPPVYSAVSNGFSQSDALKLERKRNRKKKILIASAIILVVIVIPIILFILFSSAIKLKTISYDNGEGSQFRLSFYGVYNTDKVFSSVSPEQRNKGVNPDLMGLYSKVRLHAEAPIKMYISSSALSEANTARYAKNKGCDAIPVAFTVHNNYADDDLNACAIRGYGHDLLYVVTFKDSSKFYVVTINQNVNYRSDDTKEQAQSKLAEIGLEAYQDELKKIVGSIRVVN